MKPVAIVFSLALLAFSRCYGSGPESVSALASPIPYTRMPVIVCDPSGCYLLHAGRDSLLITDLGYVTMLAPGRPPIALIARAGLDWSGCAADRLPFIVFADAMAEYAEAARIGLEAKRLAAAIMGPDLVIPHPYTELGQRWKKVIEPLMKKGVNTDADLTVIEKYLRDLRAATDRRNAFRNRRNTGK